MAARIVRIGREVLRTGLVTALLLTVDAASAQEGIERMEVSRADAPGSDTTEVIVGTLRMMPGASVPLHTHHGDEHLYVIKGGPMETADGKIVEFADGMSAHLPRGQVHGGVTSRAEGEVVALTVHIVDKGKPLNVPVE